MINLGNKRYESILKKFWYSFKQQNYTNGVGEHFLTGAKFFSINILHDQLQNNVIGFFLKKMYVK